MIRLNRHDPLDRSQMLIQQAKLRQGLALDDRQFIQMINDSGIILNRDHTKWNYELIVDILEGPLMNPKRSGVQG
jgi:rapamycin-insensitive companion of mTOR